ncbi:uncharacterized protein DUF2617 [Kineococcus xinjiangensis]|uniref:Uncharacterized protein DUF2617 n=1 Tax=Kineococcus xinjiangensis TaxID=512762 RepID=A0A2S6ILZ6_9ACTN|nr:DUF2617 family protein [Kineococcus xinjiangensis]PPK95263.1 uncharacterized protein DUF2617 [Kineococcus xinjiangensis]
MLRALAAPYADVTAAGLTWRLGGPAPEALAELSVRDAAGGTLLVLRVLGASHEVLLGDAGRPWLTEVVACLPGVGPFLPERVRQELPVPPEPGSAQPPGAPPAPGRSAHYSFDSAVARLGAGEFAARVEELRASLERREHALVGVFPGAADALTALVGEVSPDGRCARWQTWHTYPQAGEIVSTSTSVALPAPVVDSRPTDLGATV